MTASTTAATSGAVTAQVALCWAEYYNGKWQPTKTSDISLPTMIGPFDQARLTAPSMRYATSCG